MARTKPAAYRIALEPEPDPAPEPDMVLSPASSTNGLVRDTAIRLETDSASPSWVTDGNDNVELTVMPPARSAAPSQVSSASHAPRQTRSDYRSDIDGLRAVAVSVVIVYHMDKSWIPGGFTGVDIFFVISGFVVSGSLLREQAPSALDLFGGFYSRRVKRLAPALSVTVLATVVFLSVIVPPFLGCEPPTCPARDGDRVGAESAGAWPRTRSDSRPTPGAYVTWDLRCGRERAWGERSWASLGLRGTRRT